MKLNELGEFKLIQKISERFSKNLPKGLVGIGDDCAVIPQSNGNSILVTTDMLIEKTHFLFHEITPRDLGYKTLAVNLSDIAAMGGTPEYALLSMGLPENLNLKWVKEFLEGIEELSGETSTHLIGGDTARVANEICLSVTVFGKINSRHVKLRSGAKAGDIIGVTGELGDSGVGLKILLGKYPRAEAGADFFLHKHHRPRPHLDEGRFLSKKKGVHSMMDVSDGLDFDIRRIMERSGCGARVDLDKIPVSKELSHFSKKFKFDAQEQAVTSGEDYCLLIAIDAVDFEKINSQFTEKFGHRIYKVGQMTTQLDLEYIRAGKAVKIPLKGYDHFNKA